MPNRSLIIVLILTIITLGGCRSTVDVSSEAPPQQALTVYEQNISVINIPVSFDLNQLERKLNEEFKGVLYKDESFNDDNIKYTISKAGNINVMADNNKLYISLPLHIWTLGKWEWKPCDVCPKLSKSQDATFDVTLKAQTEIALTTDWKVKTNTTAHYNWDKKPVLELGVLKIPLSGILDLAIAPQVNKLSAQFDNELQKRIDLKSYVRQGWNDVQRPVLLDKETNTWLKIEPLSVITSPIELKSDELRMNVGITSYIETTSGLSPAAKGPSALPDLITNAQPNDTTNISLTGFITYTQAAELLKEQLLDKTFYFEDNKYEVRINALNLSPLGEKLLLTLNLNGHVMKGRKKKNIEGKIFLEGIPYYDPADVSIKVMELDFTLNTKNVLAKTASWIAEIGFGKALQEKMRFALDDQIETAKALIQKNLNEKLQISDIVSLKGRILSLEPKGIYLTPEGIKAIVNANGKVSLTVNYQ